MAISQVVRSDRTRGRLLAAVGHPAVPRYPGASDLSGAESPGAVASEPGDVPRPLAREVADGRRDLRRLAAPVVRVVLDEAVRLPRRYPNAAEGGREYFGRHVDEPDVAAGRPRDRSGHVVVRDRRGPSDRVSLTQVTQLR